MSHRVHLDRIIFRYHADSAAGVTRKTAKRNVATLWLDLMETRNAH